MKYLILFVFICNFVLIRSTSLIAAKDEVEATTTNIKFPKKLLDSTSADSPFVTESISGRLLHGIDDEETKNNKFCFISHGCWGGSQFGKVTHRKVADLIAAKTQELSAKFVVAAGDNFYTKGIKSVKDPRFNDTFTNVYVKPHGEIMKSVPFIVALGNHDARGSIFAQINMTYHDPNWFFPYTYYSVLFRKSSIAVVVLDCPLFERCAVNPPGSARCWDNNQQKYFLEAALEYAAAQKISHRIVTCHYPLYANGPHVNHQFLKDLLDPVMVKYGVSMYINADNHYLQVSKHKESGIFYVNSGGGGGYRLHKKADKGYKIDKNNVFEFLGNGIFTHCLNLKTNLMKTSAFTIDDGGKKELFSFESKGVASAAVAVAVAVAGDVDHEKKINKMIETTTKNEGTVVFDHEEKDDDDEVQKDAQKKSLKPTRIPVVIIRQADFDSTALSTVALLSVVLAVLLYRLTKNRIGKKAS